VIIPDIAVGDDVGARISGTAPPLANGTRFAVIDLPPSNAPRMHRSESATPARERPTRVEARRHYFSVPARAVSSTRQHQDAQTDCAFAI
jgi:hypothetical protein